MSVGMLAFLLKCCFLDAQKNIAMYVLLCIMYAKRYQYKKISLI